jgi:hypothetical protein
MATYKEIKGVTVQTLDSDPVLNVGAWSSQSSLNTTRSQAAGFGTASNMGVAGGNTGSPVTNFELWNGTSWTETTEINTARRNARGLGTYTEGLIFGGWHPPAGSVNTEDWNGSAWTEVNDMTRPGARQSQGSFGTYTAAVTAGGEPGTGSFQLVEKWDGTNWTEVNELNTGRSGAMGFGIVTSGFIISGYSPPAPPGNVVTQVESYNGTSFTETTDVNTGRGAGGATGTTTAGLIYGGQNPGSSYQAITESWDGSSWTELADLGTGRSDGGWTPSPSLGNTSAMLAGGIQPGSPPYIGVVEEWSFPPPTSSILTEGDLFLSGGASLKGFGKAAGIPSATWSSGGALNTARTIGGGFGLTIPTAVCAGGYNPGGWKALVEEYNGSAFTEVNDMPTAIDDMGSGGSLTAGIIFGGEVPPSGSTTNKNFGYDGTNWTELTNLNTARRAIGGAGVQTSALAFGGQEPGSASAKTESWDGTSWTETSDLNTARMGIQGAGHSNTAAIGAGGGLSPVVNNVEQWDGSSWTEKNNLNTARSLFAGGGVSTAALFYGGYVGTPSYSGKTESWNGTSMTEVNDMATGRGGSGALPAGGAVSQIAAGGNPATATSETFEAEATLSDVTVS